MQDIFVKVKSGEYRKQPINNVTFPLLKGLIRGKKSPFVTVDATKQIPGYGKIRVTVDSEDDIEYLQKDADGNLVEVDQVTAIPGPMKIVEAPVEDKETPEERHARLEKQFGRIGNLAQMALDSKIRGVVISGAPGLGKTYEAEDVLEKAQAEWEEQGAPWPLVEIVGGVTSAIGLYQLLYHHRNRGQVLLFDDCDRVFFDEDSLMIMKRVLDSGKKRTVHWNTESHVLRNNQIPRHFEYRGSVMFITNRCLTNVTTPKIAEHLKAIRSRCHFLELRLDTADIFTRIEQVIANGMLDEYDLPDEAPGEIVQFMKDNVNRLHELSLRTVLKVADYYGPPTSSGETWQELAESTTLVPK